MSRIIAGLLFIILCGAFFEAGLVLSDTIVTGQPPHVSKLLSSQLDELTSLLSFLHHSTIKEKTVSINNQNDVIAALMNKTGLNGINSQNLTAQTTQSTSNNEINVTITAMGYKTTTTGNGTNGTITITPSQNFSITATATGTTENGGVTIDVKSIVITGLNQIYNNNTS